MTACSVMVGVYDETGSFDPVPCVVCGGDDDGVGAVWFGWPFLTNGGSSEE